MALMQKHAHPQLLAIPEFAHRLIKFSPDDGGGSPGSPAESGEAGQQPSTANANGGGKERTFSQAEVNSIMGDVRSKAQNAMTNELLAKLKFDKLEDLEEMVKSARKTQQAQMSEVERAQARLAELEPIVAEHETLKSTLSQYETIVTERVTALITDLNVPDYVQSLLEGKTAAEKLQYLNDNRTAFASNNGKTLPKIDAENGGRHSKKELIAAKTQEVNQKYGIKTRSN